MRNIVVDGGGLARPGSSIYVSLIRVWEYVTVFFLWVLLRRVRYPIVRSTVFVSQAFVCLLHMQSSECGRHWDTWRY